MAEVLLSPRSALGVPLLTDQFGWLNKRDAVFIVLGMLFFRLIAILAEGVALTLT